jgi:hypothetical protein
MGLSFTNVASTKSPELAQGTAGAKTLIEPIPKTLSGYQHRGSRAQKPRVRTLVALRGAIPSDLWNYALPRLRRGCRHPSEPLHERYQEQDYGDEA